MSVDIVDSLMERLANGSITVDEFMEALENQSSQH